MEDLMLELTVKQRIAAVVILFFSAVGGSLFFLSGNKALTQEYADDVTLNTIYVDVRGAVVKPGVKQLKPGTRKFEVLELAGGALPEADLNRINLAEFVEDGEQIYLPKKGEFIETTVKNSKKGRTTKSRLTKSSLDNDGKSKTRPEAPQWPIDLNSADQEQLELVPGIGQFLAARIIEYRNQNGPFQNYEALDGVNGIGPGKLEKLRPYLCVK
jgi:competence protein ComEA